MSQPQNVKYCKRKVDWTTKAIGLHRIQYEYESMMRHTWGWCVGMDENKTCLEIGFLAKERIFHTDNEGIKQNKTKAVIRIPLCPLRYV